MPAATIVLLGVFVIYAVAAVVAAFVLQERGWRRFVPVASVAAVGFPWLRWLPIPGLPMMVLAPFSWLLGMVLIFYTLRFAWSGRHWVERVLRMTSMVLLGFVLVLFFLYGNVA